MRSTQALLTILLEDALDSRPNKIGAGARFPPQCTRNSAIQVVIYTETHYPLGTCGRCGPRLVRPFGRPRSFIFAPSD